MSDGPIPSPQPPKNPPERTESGEFRAVVQPMLDAHDRKMTLRGWLMAFVSAVLAVGSVVILAIIFIDNRVQAQTDAGVKVIEAENKAIDARVTTLEKRFDRFDQKMDAALDALRVPLSARPPPYVDGGR